MFTNKISVLFVQRSSIQLYDVVVGSKAEIALVDEVKVGVADMTRAVHALFSRHSRKQVRVLLASELSLITQLSIDKQLVESASREDLFAKVQQHIPESFSQEQWDFLVLGAQDDADATLVKIAVFVPVLDVYEQLAKALAAEEDITGEIPVVPQESLSNDLQEAVGKLAAQPTFDPKTKSILSLTISVEKQNAETSDVNEDADDTAAEALSESKTPSDEKSSAPAPKKSKFMIVLIILSVIALIGSTVITVLINL